MYLFKKLHQQLTVSTLVLNLVFQNVKIFFFILYSFITIHIIDLRVFIPPSPHFRNESLDRSYLNKTLSTCWDVINFPEGTQRYQSFGHDLLYLCIHSLFFIIDLIIFFGKTAQFLSETVIYIVNLDNFRNYSKHFTVIHTCTSILVILLLAFLLQTVRNLSYVIFPRPMYIQLFYYNSLPFPSIQ